jgi:GMP synthase (glutamine-hydrolysing)
MSKVVCVLYDDPVNGMPETYARDTIPHIEKYPGGQTAPTPMCTSRSAAPVEDVLLERGFTVRYVDADRESLQDLDLSTAQLLISLGGPVAANDDSRYPWIVDQLKLIERSIARLTPTLGICFGAQLVARALGARVYPARTRELGWKPLLLTEEGKTSSMATLAPEAASMLHWHAETFDLPPQATLLASTPGVPHQIFEWGNHVIGFQCHPEFRATDIEAWLVGHAFEIARTDGANVAQIRRDTARFAPALVRQARSAFGDWLTAAGL